MQMWTSEWGFVVDFWTFYVYNIDMTYRLNLDIQKQIYEKKKEICNEI